MPNRSIAVVDRVEEKIVDVVVVSDAVTFGPSSEDYLIVDVDLGESSPRQFKDGKRPVFVEGELDHFEDRLGYTLVTLVEPSSDGVTAGQYRLEGGTPSAQVQLKLGPYLALNVNTTVTLDESGEALFNIKALGVSQSSLIVDPLDDGSRKATEFSIIAVPGDF